MKLILVLIILLTTPILLISQVIKNETRNYTIEKTENWEHRIEGNKTTIFSKNEGLFDNYQENLQVHIFPANGMNLEQVYETQITFKFSKTFKNFQLIEEGEMLIDGNKSKWIRFKCKDQSVKFEDLALMFVKNDKAYYIVCLSKDKDFENYQSRFLEMIKSIKV